MTSFQSFVTPWFALTQSSLAWIETCGAMSRSDISSRKQSRWESWWYWWWCGGGVGEEPMRDLVSVPWSVLFHSPSLSLGWYRSETSVLFLSVALYVSSFLSGSNLVPFSSFLPLLFVSHVFLFCRVKSEAAWCLTRSIRLLSRTAKATWALLTPFSTTFLRSCLCRASRRKNLTDSTVLRNLRFVGWILVWRMFAFFWCRVLIACLFCSSYIFLFFCFLFQWSWIVMPENHFTVLLALLSVSSFAYVEFKPLRGTWSCSFVSLSAFPFLVFFFCLYGASSGFSQVLDLRIPFYRASLRKMAWSSGGLIDVEQSHALILLSSFLLLIPSSSSAFLFFLFLFLGVGFAHSLLL